MLECLLRIADRTLAVCHRTRMSLRAASVSESLLAVWCRAERACCADSGSGRLGEIGAEAVVGRIRCTCGPVVALAWTARPDCQRCNASIRSRKLWPPAVTPRSSSVCWTCSAKPSMPHRISLSLPSSQTPTLAGKAIIAAQAHRAPGARMPPSPRFHS
jgi:hypothetical protein